MWIYLFANSFIFLFVFLSVPAKYSSPRDYGFICVASFFIYKGMFFEEVCFFLLIAAGFQLAALAFFPFYFLLNRCYMQKSVVTLIFISLIFVMLGVSQKYCYWVLKYLFWGICKLLYSRFLWTEC